MEIILKNKYSKKSKVKASFYALSKMSLIYGLVLVLFNFIFYKTMGDMIVLFGVEKGTNIYSFFKVIVVFLMNFGTASYFSTFFNVKDYFLKNYIKVIIKDKIQDIPSFNYAGNNYHFNFDQYKNGNISIRLSTGKPHLSFSLTHDLHYYKHKYDTFIVTSDKRYVKTINHILNNLDIFEKESDLIDKENIQREIWKFK